MDHRRAQVAPHCSPLHIESLMLSNSYHLRASFGWAFAFLMGRCRLWAVLLIACGCCSMPVWGQSATNTASQIAAIQAEMKQATDKVRQIVNQPVTRLVRKPGMHVSTYKPGWFHEGATKPNFNSVDVRTTQEAIYDKNQYVSSDLNPGVAFIGAELEFNSMTKYFYTDYTLPKKKLTEAQMVEVNRLYRI